MRHERSVDGMVAEGSDTKDRAREPVGQGAKEGEIEERWAVGADLTVDDVA